MFDGIIMNILRKNAENQQMKVVDIYFTKIKDKNIFYGQRDTSIFLLEECYS